MALKVPGYAAILTNVTSNGNTAFWTTSSRVYRFYFSGTFAGATVKLQAQVPGGDWVDIPNTLVFAADTVDVPILRSADYRLVVAGATGSTSISCVALQCWRPDMYMEADQFLINSYDPSLLFEDGSNGFWLDASDPSVLFQDSAGTTPVTALGDPVGRWLDKSGRGNHFVQTTSGARPVWGSWPLSAAIAGRVRNLLSYSGKFDSWTVTGAAFPPSAVLDSGESSPVSGAQVYKVIEGTSNTNQSIYRESITITGSHTATVVAKDSGDSRYLGIAGLGIAGAGEMPVFDLVNGTVDVGATTTIVTSAEINPLGDGWYECIVRVNTTVSGSTFNITNCNSATDNTISNYTRAGDGASGFFVTTAQLETGSTATAYQRVGVSSRYDVSEAGQPQVYFVSPDGVDDFMVSAANVNFSATDRMFVCAGVTKKQAAGSFGIITEHTVSASAQNGSMNVAAPGAIASSTENYSFSTRGTTAQTGFDAVTFTAPNTSILSSVLNNGAASRALQVLPRVNGVIPTLNAGGAAATGAGNFVSALTYIGARAGTSLFSSANLYQLIAVGKTPTTSELNQTETFVAAKTKGSLA